jgi:hypothetical protein
VLKIVFVGFPNVRLIFFLVQNAFAVLLRYLISYHLSVVSVVVILLHSLPARQPHEQFTGFFLEFCKKIKPLQDWKVGDQFRKVLMYETVEIKAHFVDLRFWP